jgi:TRAP-type transport system periplasmic protein
MMLARRRFLTLAATALAAPAIARYALAQASASQPQPAQPSASPPPPPGPAPPAQPEVILKLHHPVSPVASAHSRLWLPWAKKIATESEGRIKVEVYAAMQLGGTPSQLYDQVREGAVDLVWTRPGATPGRFPGIEVFDLPFVAGNRAAANAKAVQEFYETTLRDEYREVHPLSLWAHDGGVLHANRLINEQSDLRGRKLRAPTRLAGEALKALGAEVVAVPFMQTSAALAQKAIDGCLLPWESVPGLKVHERVKFHCGIPATPTLSTTTFLLAMNKAKYQSLPADLKKVIDNNSGQAAAVMAAAVWDAQASAAEAKAKERGNEVAMLNDEEIARWRKATEPVVAAWTRQVKDGSKLLDTARALVKKHAA